MYAGFFVLPIMLIKDTKMQSDFLSQAGTWKILDCTSAAALPTHFPNDDED